MSRVEQLEREIAALDQAELRALREWFARFDADAWDSQFEADVKSGSLERFAERARRDYDAGLSTEL